MRAPRLLVLLLLLCSSPLARAENPLVRVDTELGAFEIELCAEVSALCAGAAPGTVENFLGYVDRGDYMDNIIHRSVSIPRYGYDFVIQTGGFRLDAGDEIIRLVPTQAPITNQFNQTNKRGSVAMARSSAVDSATSQWFVNLVDNAGTPPNGLDYQNQGFTVFGHVRGDGMQAVDAIADLFAYRIYDTPLVKNPPETPDFFDPIYENPTCTQTNCPMRAAFGSTPLDSTFAPGSVVEPQDVLPYMITLDVTRVPEPEALARGAAAFAAVLAGRPRRSRA